MRSARCLVVREICRLFERCFANNRITQSKRFTESKFETVTQGECPRGLLWFLEQRGFCLKKNVKSRTTFEDERARKEADDTVQMPDLVHYDAALLKGDGVRTVRARPGHVTFSPNE